MTIGIQLVTLTCRKCGSVLSTQNEAVFFYCASCGSGFELDEQEQFTEVPIYFALYKPDAQNFLPFWTFDAQLQLHNLDTSGKSQRGFIRLFQERGSIRFYVAAFDRDAESNKPYSLFFTYEQPQLEFIERRDRIDGVVFSQTDARALADYYFLTSEIEQKDMLRDIKYELTLQNPYLMVIGV
jgi:hypothetical protein